MIKLQARILWFILFSLPVVLFAKHAKDPGEFYQITVYHFANAEQQTVIEQYLKSAYLPALHRQQVKNVGVFTVLANDTSADKRLYVIIPLKSLQQVIELKTKLANDKEYQGNGKT